MQKDTPRYTDNFGILSKQGMIHIVFLAQTASDYSDGKLQGNAEVASQIVMTSESFEKFKEMCNSFSNKNGQ
jgi:hypothetical protein